MIRQLAYDTVPNAFDEYLQRGHTTSRLSLEHFYSSVMEIFGPEFLRKPTIFDVEKLYTCHEEKHGLLGMLGSLDYIEWAWFVCPITHKAQYCRRDHGLDPLILLEAVASEDTTGNSSKKDNLSMSNSFFALNEEEEDDEEDVENVHDESANLIQNTKAGGSSSFTAAAG
ncbi:RNA-directed DNA polymerase, eukaryota [Tanacetum coccineum]